MVPRYNDLPPQIGYPEIFDPELRNRTISMNYILPDKMVVYGVARTSLPGLRTLVVFYLISFVVLLWAAFLSAQGVMLWVSLLLVLIIIGLNFMTVMNQIKAHAARVEFQRSLTKDFERGTQETEMKKE